MIEDLPRITPDASRRARTIARCHDRLGAHRRRIEARSQPRSPRTLAGERLLVVGVCVAYLIAMAADIVAIAAAR